MSVPHFISPPCLSHLVFHISVLLSAIPLPPLIGLSAHHRSMGIHVSARNYDHDSPYGETKSLPPSFSLSLSSDLHNSHTCVTNVSYFVFCACTKTNTFQLRLQRSRPAQSLVRRPSLAARVSPLSSFPVSMHIHSNTLVHTH